MEKFWTYFPLIQQQLDETRLLIIEKVNSRNKEIKQALVELTNSGGKLLRPAFFFIFTQMGNADQQDRQQLIKIAASLEILHMATLIHDDIIDDSPLRRGTQTIQSRYGKDIAVYTGDLLFTEFFDLLADTMKDSKYLQINAHSMKRLLLGELDQMHTRYNQNITITDYLRSVNGKTAELFSLSCLEGAHFGHASKEIEQLARRIGRHIGIAFQVYDDILDYTATTETLQKPTIEDIAQGVYTLPLIFTLQEHPALLAPYLNKKEQLTAEEAAEVASIVQQLDGVEKAKEFADLMTEKARQDIAKLPKSTSRKQLQKLTELLLVRKY
ncbi:polyprenyl synthetase family protein [Enterococcus sp. BWT-B8]|uniref:polyprenyl synthetase family protein n=1 Tax=unclassified Enterococcus TaxID=2608891 RepID=UPI001E4A890E|nr:MULTISPECIES: polyprenyl synthetase family protein [unclassified Enterococcus]MCB5951958.1 polyprenyl synthetase family protein [Enterococcus sp. BWT-B8]MCB5954155.1 polyprenyl synthetase family protein [Enterococcus sp. CWB-B31]